MAGVAGESEYGGVGGLLTPVSKGTPMRPEWEQMVLLKSTDPMDADTTPERPA